MKNPARKHLHFHTGPDVEWLRRFFTSPMTQTTTVRLAQSDGMLPPGCLELADILYTITLRSYDK